VANLLYMNWKSRLIRSAVGKFCFAKAGEFYDKFVCTPEAVRRQAGSRRDAVAAGGLKFSVGIPHYNRGRLIYRPLFNLLNHPSVVEVVIVDDGSREEEFRELKLFVDSLGCGDRLKIFRREENKGALLTKLECVEKCSSDWVLVLDSDNTAFRGYLNALGSLTELDSKLFYSASWAWPWFPFEELGFEEIDFRRAVNLCRDGRLRKYYIINDGNYLVNRAAYQEAVGEIGELPSDVVDVMVVNYLWLSRGGSLQMLPRRSYFHRVDASSFYKRTEDDSKRRLVEIFKRFEKGEPCGVEFLGKLRANSF
jgi:glycosyltransferase involved in cell wall biosynthesis